MIEMDLQKSKSTVLWDKYLNITNFDVGYFMYFRIMLEYPFNKSDFKVLI